MKVILAIVKKLWNLIKDLAPEKSKVTPTSLKVGGVILSNPQDICDNFNEFIAQIENAATDSLLDSQNRTSDVLADFINKHVDVNSIFDIPKVTIELMREELDKLDNAKSMGLDGIFPKLFS